MKTLSDKSKKYEEKKQKRFLTDVIVKCVVVELLVDPVFLNAENLLAA